MAERPGSSGSRDERPRSELAKRIVSALVLGGAAILTAYWGGWPFALLWALAGGGTTFEWLLLTGRTQPRWLAPAAAALVGAAALCVAGLEDPRAGLPAVAAALGLAMAAPGPQRLLSAAGVGYGAVIAIVPVVARASGELGPALIAWMFAVVWSTDVLAFFCGRAIGGPKLWPRVSPKKTWSGFVGGTLGGTVGGVAVAAAAHARGLPLPAGDAAMLILSILASMVAQAGDLAESAFKRRLGVKDSGRLIPGHGGLMDRLDSFWAVAAFVGLLMAIGAVFEM